MVCRMYFEIVFYLTNGETGSEYCGHFGEALDYVREVMKEKYYGDLKECKIFKRGVDIRWKK